MANSLRRRDQKFIWFSKIVPLGAPKLSKDFKAEESIYQEELTTNNDHQSFWNPRCSKLGNIFIFFALTLWSQNLFSLLEILAKFRTTKMSETQVHLFHANADIKAKFTYFKSAFTNENIRDQKTNKNCL